LIVVSILIDKSAVAVWQSIKKRPLIVPSIGIIIFAIAVRFVVQQFPLINNPSPVEPIKLI
jgi:hypothetical protein